MPLAASASTAATTTAVSPAATTSSTSISTNEKPHRKQSNGLAHILSGSVAGVASKTLLQPLDLIKVRLQVQDGRSKNEYRGVLHAMQSVLRNEGLLGFYRGLTPNLMAAGVSWGSYFFTYNKFKDLLRERILPPSEPGAPAAKLGPAAHLSCAACSGVLATTLTNPIVMVKTRLQLQGKEPVHPDRMYRGVVHAFSRIVREEGFLALYRGLGPSLVLVSNGALQFMFYEELKQLAVHYLVRDESELSSHHYFLMGGLAKVMSASATYPFALTRSRLYARKPTAEVAAEVAPQSPPQSSSASLSSDCSSNSSSNTTNNTQNKVKDAKYNGMRDVFVSTLRNEGWRGFYRGLTLQLAKTAPSSAFTFLIYETMFRFLTTAAPSTAAPVSLPSLSSASSSSAPSSKPVGSNSASRTASIE